MNIQPFLFCKMYLYQSLTSSTSKVCTLLLLQRLRPQNKTKPNGSKWYHNELMIRHGKKKEAKYDIMGQYRAFIHPNAH